MRILILSDTHGFLDPRILTLAGGCDLAVHGGDIGSGEVLDTLGERLAARGGHVLSVRGNNDSPEKWPPAERPRLVEIPARLEEALPGGSLGVVHGHEVPVRDRHERLRRLFPGARALVYGHSHRLAVDRDADPWVLNPGAAGRSRTHGGPSCLVLEAEVGCWRLEIHRFEPLARPPRKP